MNSSYIKLTNREAVKYIKDINFGDPDGLYDPDLEKYFFDEDYWKKIVESNVYYVIGRKGTGKSALYQWIYQKQSGTNIIISNLSFQDFPFEKLLKLDDWNFSKPNQYQSIWRNIILIEICRMIVMDQNNIQNEEYKNISSYLAFLYGKDLKELHKQATQKVNKTSFGLSYKGSLSLGAEAERSALYNTIINNITDLNRNIEDVIIRYLKISPSAKYIIQFDQLDDNYNKYTNNEDYFQCIISLFKVIYNISQTFRRDNIPIKVIGYLRSDIFYSINQYDSESARWEQYKYNLNWAIINRNDWFNSRLLQLINRRINASVDVGKKNSFPIIFDKDLLQIQLRDRYSNLFPYIIHRTFHRPRDIIQFCLKIQEQVNTNNSIGFHEIENAEKQYSLWLLGEVENEIGHVVNDTTSLYEFLRELGSNDYSISDFKAKYARFSKILKFDNEELLKYLYSVGVILNINFYGNGKREVYSITRNDKSVLNQDLRIMTHYGFYKGIYTTKFMSK